MAGVHFSETHERRAVGKAARRVVPLLALLYFVSFLDRVNVGFGALTMNADLGLTPTSYGLGAGIFFAGYIAFGVPANFLMRRFGASRWIGAIAIVWGCVSLCMAFVQSPAQFYLVRFCLGVAEAGFFPGVILYLTTWFPQRVQGRIVANLFVALPLSNILGAPLSGVLLETHLFGLHGWQVMFLVEALPAILLGLVSLRYLPDTPDHAAWLSSQEREALRAASGPSGPPAMPIRSGLISPVVWSLGVVYFLIVVALYGFAFWAPQIFQAVAPLTTRQIGGLTAIPYVGAALAIVVWSRHSDRHAERVWHLVIPCLVAAAGFVLAGQGGGLLAITLSFLLATSGIYAACVVFWTLPPTFLSGAAAAAGIALINSMGNVAGYLGPSMMGQLKAHTGGYDAGIRAMAASIAAAAAIALAVGLYIRRRQASVAS